MINTAWQNTNLTPLGREIKHKLIDQGMTQRQLAAALGIAPQYITKILSGQRSGERYLLKICRLLDIDLDKYAAA